MSSLKRIALLATKVIAGLLALLVLAIVALLAWYRATYDDELVAIQQELRALPGVTLIDSGGNEDLTLEDIYAEIEVERLGKILLLNLTQDSFRVVEHLYLGSIGGIEPRIASCGYIGVYKTATGEPTRTRFYASSIDLGPAGPFAAQLNGGISTVPDVVRRYEEVHAFLASWPRCPEASRHEDADGTVHYRSAAPVGTRCWPDTPFPSIKQGQGRC